MASKLFRAVILGAPGSGKGTISGRVVRDFKLKHLSSGDLLRAQILANTELGKNAKRYITEGKLVPDALMVDLISAELDNMKDSSWLLDGFPRTKTQALQLQQRHPIDLAINLNVPFETIIDRIQCRWIHAPSGRIYNTEFSPPKEPGLDDITKEPLIQREDDKPDSVRQRLNVYSSTMSLVVDYYRQQGKLTEFSGTETNKIWPHVHAYLKQFIENQAKL